MHFGHGVRVVIYLPFLTHVCVKFSFLTDMRKRCWTNGSCPRNKKLAVHVRANRLTRGLDVCKNCWHIHFVCFFCAQYSVNVRVGSSSSRSWISKYGWIYLFCISVRAYMHPGRTPLFVVFEVIDTYGMLCIFKYKRSMRLKRKRCFVCFSIALYVYIGHAVQVTSVEL